MSGCELAGLARRLDALRSLEGFEGAKKQFRKPTERLCPAASLLVHGWRRCGGLEGFEGAGSEAYRQTVCLLAGLARRLGALRGLGRI